MAETEKLGAKSGTTPIVANLRLTKEGELLKEPESSRRLVGKLNYLTIIGPDIAYSMNIVSQYMCSPIIDHWAALEQIMCYLKAALEHSLLNKDYGPTNVECFYDTNWAGSKEDTRSISGYCSFV